MMKTAWENYQQLCDRIFGKGSIVIKPTDKSNNIIGALNNPSDFIEFKTNFQKRLERLRRKFEGTTSYTVLKKTVKQIADPFNWEGAYAEIVAYDILHNGHHGSEFILDVTLDGKESYASDLGGKLTNEDGYLPDYDIYFDVKSLADTTGNILKELIYEACHKAGVSSVCSILPEYPLDDDESEYQQKRRQLFDELRDYLAANKPAKHSLKSSFRSHVLPSVLYHVLWGCGVNGTEGTYNATKHGENSRYIILKRYAKKFMKSHPSIIVLVNFPWYNNRINSFANADEEYYKKLAHETFSGYLNSSEPMSKINPKYKGSETPHEISRHLTGVLFIDDHSIYTDTYSCHLYLNPNAVNKIENGNSYLKEVVKEADTHSIVDTLRNDNC